MIGLRTPYSFILSIEIGMRFGPHCILPSCPAPKRQSAQNTETVDARHDGGNVFGSNRFVTTTLSASSVKAYMVETCSAE